MCASDAVTFLEAYMLWPSQCKVAYAQTLEWTKSVVTRLIFALVVSEKKTVQVKGKGRCIYDLWSCMHVDVLLAYERTESGTHGELGSHISVFCLEPLTIGGRSSC